MTDACVVLPYGLFVALPRFMADIRPLLVVASRRMEGHMLSHTHSVLLASWGQHLSGMSDGMYVDTLQLVMDRVWRAARTHTVA